MEPDECGNEQTHRSKTRLPADPPITKSSGVALEDRIEAETSYGEEHCGADF